METTIESFGAWLRSRRRALDLTQQRLADLVGCSAVTIRKFEAEERLPSRELARLLAKTLAVPPEQEAWFVAFARGTAVPDPPAAEKAAPPSPEKPVEESASTNLPAALTTLFGREGDVAAVCEALTRPGTRLLTLTGPGGTGKTTLALEAGRWFLSQPNTPFPDGIMLVELAPISDPALVLPVIAATLGLKEKGSTAEAALTAYLRPRKELLILDNFEQVISAAGQLVALLEAAPGLRLLVTSRSALNLYGEREYPVAALALPGVGQKLSTEALMEYSAVSLFVERAQAVKPAFSLAADNAEAVAALCRRLDGLPLAIELAAARIKFFSPAALLAQVSQRLDLLAGQGRHTTDRQRTLKGAIEWSYNLLNEEEKRLFNRLAVFVGEFSLGDAAAVVGDGGDLLEPLLGLVGHSVLQQVDTADADDPIRFRLLLTIREYAREQLAASGEAEQLCDRHAAHFLALAEEAQKHFMQATQRRWLQIGDRSMDNFRAAMAWLLRPEAGEPRQQMGARLVYALQRYWDIRGYLQEMAIWVEQALAYRSHLPPELLLSLLHITILLAAYRSEFERAKAGIAETLALARQSGKPLILATALQFAGMIAGQLGNYEEADAMLSESLELERAAGPSRLVNLSVVLNNLGIVARRLGDYDRAAALLAESLALKRARADQRAVATTLSTMGDLARLQGQYEKAGGYLRESLLIRAELDDRIGMANSINNVAALWMAEGKHQEAVVLFGAGEALRRAVQIALTPVEQAEYEASCSFLREQLGDGLYNAAWETGQNRPLAEIAAWAVGKGPLATGPLPSAVSDTAELALKRPSRFVREHLLAGGGMGEVYLGRDTQSGETVAIKKLKAGLLADHPELPQRLVSEAQILRQLNHPNIVRMIDSYQEGEDYLIVMEYVSGGSLREMIQDGGQLPLERVVALALELADALARAHHVGIIHRDLKPENVLLSADGTPRLSDFGIAYRPGEDTRLTIPGSTIMGTPAYSSPEALSGLDVDARSDIWSFGALLYEMATGRNPFGQPDLTGTLAAILIEPLPNLGEERPDAPTALVDLVCRMLVRKREERLGSMRQVAAVLEDVRSSLG